MGVILSQTNQSFIKGESGRSISLFSISVDMYTDREMIWVLILSYPTLILYLFVVLHQYWDSPSYLLGLQDHGDSCWRSRDENKNVRAQGHDGHKVAVARVQIQNVLTLQVYTCSTVHIMIKI